MQRHYVMVSSSLTERIIRSRHWFFFCFHNAVLRDVLWFKCRDAQADRDRQTSSDNHRTSSAMPQPRCKLFYLEKRLICYFDLVLCHFSINSKWRLLSYAQSKSRCQNLTQL